MAMLDAGMTEAAQRTPGPGMPDENERLSCPECGAQFTEDEAKQAAGAPPGEVADLASAAPEPVVRPGAPETTCPECGGKMEGGRCSSCGYSKEHSPMREAATKYRDLQPEHAKSDVDQVVTQGRRVRERMRGAPTFGRA
jgi:hypothetical protein